MTWVLKNKFNLIPSQGHGVNYRSSKSKIYNLDINLGLTEKETSEMKQLLVGKLEP
jgi:hypothetical protein